MNDNLIPGLERAREIMRVYLPRDVSTGCHPILFAWEDLNREIEREKSKTVPDKHPLMHCQKCGEFRGHGHDEICKSKDSESGTVYGTLANKGPI